MTRIFALVVDAVLDCTMRYFFLSGVIILIRASSLSSHVIRLRCVQLSVRGHVSLVSKLSKLSSDSLIFMIAKLSNKEAVDRRCSQASLQVSNPLVASVRNLP